MNIHLSHFLNLKIATKKVWTHFKTDSLFRNSTYLILSTGVQSALGFFFWILCSKLYTPHDIGLATSMIAASNLILSTSMLGFSNVIIRYLPTSTQPNHQISNAFIITGIAGTLTTTIFLSWAYITNNPILDTTEHPILPILIFFSFVLFTVISTLSDSIFVAYREARYVFYKSTLSSILKLFLPLLTMGVGFLGIVGSITSAVVTSASLGLFWLVTRFRFRPIWRVDSKNLSTTKNFATGNYIANLFGMLPSTLIPLIVVSRLNPQEAAFLYMPMAIIALLNIVPGATAQSLFAEISKDEESLFRNLTKALRNLFFILLPSVLFILFFGTFILGFFGPLYAEHGTRTLQILAIASLFGALNYFGDTLLNIKKMMRPYIAMNAINAALIVCLSYFAAPYGLEAIAVASLIGQILTLTLYSVINRNLISRIFAIL